MRMIKLKNSAQRNVCNASVDIKAFSFTLKENKAVRFRDNGYYMLTAADVPTLKV